jgi:hypothetical protein
MKKTMMLTAAAALLLASCEGNKTNNEEPSNNESTTVGVQSTETDTLGDPAGMRSFINKDSANRMISSYLESIPMADQSTSLASLIIDADSLRAYLNDTSLHIKKVKIMFAHTLPYINSGNYGVFAGYGIGKLTTVLAGYDSSNNYRFWGGNAVMDNGRPCPNTCPSSGTASSNILLTDNN